jgi:hypothetical protein
MMGIEFAKDGKAQKNDSTKQMNMNSILSSLAHKNWQAWCMCVYVVGRLNNFDFE